jgi:hypothetical protein
VAASNSCEDFGGAFMWLPCVHESQQRSYRVRQGRAQDCARPHYSAASLRWHYPDQVRRVFLTHASL